MQGVKEKALELLRSGKAQRVLGWKAGEFFYDLTPGTFESAAEIEREFQYSVFAGANLSKYCIAESKKDGVTAVFLKPCDTYSFVQLLKEYKIKRENVYILGVQCDGMCDMEKLKASGVSGVISVTEDGENLKIATIYGEETVQKSDVLLLKCETCKSKKLAVFDEILGEQGGKARKNDAGGALFLLARGAVALHPLQRVPECLSGVHVREVRVR